jgi:hypothetical protein
MTTTVASQLMAAIKARKFPTVARLFAPKVDFQAWTPSGRWVAEDGGTASKIIEAWFTPGAGVSTINWSSESSAGRGSLILEYEMTWKVQPDDQTRMLRQVFLMTIKDDRITSARVYCAGPHTEFPDVDLDKQRRMKGLTAGKPLPPKAITARAS